MRPIPDERPAGSDLFRAMLERGSDVISLHDRDGIMCYQSPSITRILGYTPDELVGQPVLHYIHPDDVDATRRAIEAIQAAPGRHPVFETRFRHKNGSWCWFECRATNLLDDPAVGAVIFNATDITARKAADEALRRSEAYFRALIEHMSDVVTVLSADGTIRYESPSLVRVLGYDPEEMVGRDVWTFVHPDDLRRVRSAFAALQEHVVHRFRFRHKDGSWRVLEASGRYAPDASAGHMVIVTSRDITERVRTEAELQRIDRLLHTIVSGAPMAVFALDRNGVFTLSIGKGLEAVGLRPGEIVGRSAFELYPNPEVHQQLRRALAGEAFVTCADEGSRTYQIWWAPVREAQPDGTAVVGVAMDITERRELEDQLRQAQRLESIGLLAGGIAHDFNNMLTVINGYAELLHEQLPADSSWRHDVDEVRKAGDKAASLAYQLLAFSRKQMLQPRSIDLNVVVRDVTRMLQRVIGEHIDLRTSLAPDLCRVHADPNQLVQVLLNLSVNARDAMPGGGTLTVSTRNIPGAAGTVRPSGVELSVSDTGVGMDEATLARIFEPFFTTKPTGKGTGMGLATVYGIVKQSGGDIRVRSAPGAGSTFTIVLPPEAAAAAGDAVVAESAPRGSERILLVEDESLVRELTARMLSTLGYRVTEAADPATAIAHWSAEPHAFDLLITDVVLPHMSGRELVNALMAEGAAPKVLYMSGYTDDAVLQHGVATEAMPFVQKPFTSADLAVAVRSVLDLPRSTP